MSCPDLSSRGDVRSSFNTVPLSQVGTQMGWSEATHLTPDQKHLQQPNVVRNEARKLRTSHHETITAAVQVPSIYSYRPSTCILSQVRYLWESRSSSDIS